MTSSENNVPADAVDDTKPSQPDLGRPIGEHQLRPDLRRLLTILGVLGLLAGLVLGALGYWRYQTALERYGPALVWRWSAPFFVMGLLSVLAGLLIFLSRLRKAALKVQTFRHGMIYQRGKARQIIPWQEVRHVYTTAFNYGVFGVAWRGRKEVLLLYDAHSKLLLTSALSDLEDLADTIKEHVYPELLPLYTEAFRQGRALVFGPIRVTSEGIQKGRRLLRWEKLGEVRIARGKLQLHPASETGGKRLLVATHLVPNVELCAQLIERLGRRK